MEDLSRYIEHTLLKQDARKEDFIKLLLTTEPFCNYQEDVLASIKKGEIV